MNPWHTRALQRTRLLAAGALDERERERAERHLEACHTCRAEHATLVAVLAAVDRDDLRAAEPSLPLALFAARVHARLDERPARATWAAWSTAGLRPAWATAAALLALLTVARTPRVDVGARTPSTSRAAAHEDDLLLPSESLQRLERGAARAQTARYLNEAQDVLVTVAARLPRCRRRAPRVEVAAEARRSRELLARRALMVDAGNGHVAAARGVLVDVERVLREVAAFDDCEARGRLEAVGQELDQRRLLMRMALMQRELSG